MLTVFTQSPIAQRAGAAVPVGGDVHVFVGYADGFHSHSTQFPTPWNGDARVTFEGCSPTANCHFDGGAVRIHNETSSTVTVNSITVHVDTCSYTGWPATNLTPGSQLIVTQLLSGPANGCTGPSPNHFDTSDVGPGGQNYNGVCTPDAITPTVDVTINGVTTTYLDAGQVLNTGGIDLADCPKGSNESHPWAELATQYIALGDSFSSGEGVAPYFAGTATSGTNECHRSTRSYPVLVASALGYHQFSNWPCSGAVVAGVWGTGGPLNPGVGTVGGIGQWNEPPQITHVNQNDGLVTISIGGNDVGFGAMAKGCIVEGATYYAANQAIHVVNSRVIGYTNAQIDQVNDVIDLANRLPFVNIPNLALVPHITPLTDPGACLANLPGMIGRLQNGGTETMFRTGNAVEGPCVPTSCPAPPSGSATFNFTAPSLVQLYLQIAKQAAPNAKIEVLAYPPIVNPAGVTNPCSINLRAPFSGSASAFIHPFQLLPALNSLPNFLKNQIPNQIGRSVNLSRTVSADVPAFTPTAVANLLLAQTQLNATIQAAVTTAAAIDPNIEFVNPYAQFAPPVNSGRGGWFCNNPSTNILGGPRTTTPFFNEARALNSTLSISSTNLSFPVVSFNFGGVDPGSVHPNAPGQRSLACAVLGFSVARCDQ